MTALLTDEAVDRAGEEFARDGAEDNLGSVAENKYAFIRGAFFARSIYEARLAEDAKVQAGLVEALQDLLAYAESQICSHEETHRGGAIWEICDICGDCWADDDGGKPPRQDPEEIVATRSALLAAAKVLE